MNVGLELRREREWQKRSLDSISSATKISVARLMAIEAMDGAALPPEVYLRGHLRTYAAELGFDPTDIAKRYLAMIELTPPPPPWSVESPEGQAVLAARAAADAAAAEERAQEEAEARAAREAAAQAAAARRAAAIAATTARAQRILNEVMSSLIPLPKLVGRGGLVSRVGQVGEGGQVGRADQVGRVGRVRQVSLVGLVDLVSRVNQVGPAFLRFAPRVWPPSPMIVACLLAVVLGLFLAIFSDRLERAFPVANAVATSVPASDLRPR